MPITREIAVEPPEAKASASSAPPETAEFDAPDFGQSTRRRSWRGFKAAAILAVGIAVGGIAYQTRQYWLPSISANSRAVSPKLPAASPSLVVADESGQLKIRWDRNAPALRRAIDATLQITDGDTPVQSVKLDSEHLAAGGFTYARESERVDAALIVTEQGGAVVRALASFLAKCRRAERLARSHLRIVRLTRAGSTKCRGTCRFRPREFAGWKKT
ncbi:MAG: hypothetical protein WDO73_29815 [Ignavibacteriota bacterium]